MPYFDTYQSNSDYRALIRRKRDAQKHAEQVRGEALCALGAADVHVGDRERLQQVGDLG